MRRKTHKTISSIDLCRISGERVVNHQGDEVHEERRIDEMDPLNSFVPFVPFVVKNLPYFNRNVTVCPR